MMGIKRTRQRLQRTSASASNEAGPGIFALVAQDTESSSSRLIKTHQSEIRRDRREAAFPCLNKKGAKARTNLGLANRMGLKAWKWTIALLIRPASVRI